ncbi:hypothetical protein AVEN_11136-1 [Araneus ventricosus]|uniref:Uncharacterized protein n=1 Tax=Araneus ventricosus TaxID=182803 RepID=A0A4Y2U4B4_ARAVE|nr:hypothetical protein AVEN_11136-1 [Araneus ventricosus]
MTLSSVNPTRSAEQSDPALHFHASSSVPLCFFGVNPLRSAEQSDPAHFHASSSVPLCFGSQSDQTLYLTCDPLVQLSHKICYRQSDLTFPCTPHQCHCALEVRA